MAKLTMPGGMNMAKKRQAEIARQKGFTKAGTLDTADQLVVRDLQLPGGRTNDADWYRGAAKKKKGRG